MTRDNYYVFLESDLACHAAPDAQAQKVRARDTHGQTVSCKWGGQVVFLAHQFSEFADRACLQTIPEAVQEIASEDKQVCGIILKSVFLRYTGARGRSACTAAVL